MGTRELTGNWFLKKRFFGGYTLMVEVKRTHMCEDDFTESPEFTSWEKAKDYDFILLSIPHV